MNKKIPKIIHQIWIGPNKCPDFINTWSQKNPDYIYKLWDEEKIKNELYPLINQHLYDLYEYEKDNVWNGRANLIRYEILLKYGGIYIDADIKCIRSLDDFLLNNDIFFIYANEKLRGNILNNAVIGSTINNKILNHFIYTLNKYKKIIQPSHIFSGPTFITNELNKIEHNYKTLKITKYPSYYFYPHFYNSAGDYDGNFKSYGEHYWGTTKSIYGKI